MLNKQKILSEFLAAKGIAAPEQIHEALRIQQSTQERIEEIFRKIDIPCDDNLSDVIIDELGLSVIDPSTFPHDDRILGAVNSFFANRFRIFPLHYKDSGLLIAFDTPFNFLSLDYFSAVLGMTLDAELITKKRMDELLGRYYPAADQELSVVSETAPGRAETLPPEEEAPVIQLVSVLIADAFRKRASDIHIEPLNDRLRIRYRIDGLLREVQSPEKKLQASIISRIKLMAGMNIAEKRLPQDGRIRTIVDNRELDLRISTLPAHYGESVVLRILDRRVMRTEELGFSEQQRGLFAKSVSMPNGIILVTGP
ncbi:MAG: ATPase, T2SS/T4P/T4SS family, partial [Candidatus Omnitrophica bacterium]|nr:ATPase, T2SS/T4P/T4SS family [Candidatus Omnitrophota bacterium]